MTPKQYYLIEYFVGLSFIVFWHPNNWKSIYPSNWNDHAEFSDILSRRSNWCLVTFHVLILPKNSTTDFRLAVKRLALFHSLHYFCWTELSVCLWFGVFTSYFLLLVVQMYSFPARALSLLPWAVCISLMFKACYILLYWFWVSFDQSHWIGLFILQKTHTWMRLAIVYLV